MIQRKQYQWTQNAGNNRSKPAGMYSCKKLTAAKQSNEPNCKSPDNALSLTSTNYV